MDQQPPESSKPSVQAQEAGARVRRLKFLVPQVEAIDVRVTELENDRAFQTRGANQERQQFGRTNRMIMGIRDIAAQTVRDEAKVAAQKVLDTATQVAGRSSHIARLREISEKLLDPDLVFRILDNLPDGILLVDKKGVIQLVNKQTEAMFGYTRFELDGSPLSLLIPSFRGIGTRKFIARVFREPD